MQEILGMTVKLTSDNLLLFCDQEKKLDKLIELRISWFSISSKQTHT